MTAVNQVLLIPGLSCNRRIWQPQIDALKDRAECWVAPLPAIDDLGAIAEAILEEAPRRFCLAAFSMGGYIAFEILRRAPERVDRLCLLATTAKRDTPSLAMRRRTMLKALERVGYLEMWRLAIQRLVTPENRTNPALMADLVGQVYETGRHAFVSHQEAMLRRGDYRDVARSIRCPTTVIAGREDIATTVDEMAGLARSIPRARMVVVDRAAHMLTVEQPNATSIAMRQWLAEEQLAAAA